MKTLKSINPNKATGPDNIPNKVLKMAVEILSPSLSAIFNRSLSMGIYPDDWKMARVLPIFKSGDKDDIGNYRPISIISAIACNPTDLENLMNSSLVNLNRWLIANKLSLNIAKTEFMVIDSRQRLATFDNHELRVTVDREPVRQVTSTKTLGLTLDENLTWKNHIEVISKKVSSGIGALKRVRGLIDRETAIKVHKGFVEPVWDVAQYGMGSVSL